MAKSGGQTFFSVIIPWHGDRDHLLRATASLKRQTETSFELLIVCNGRAADMEPVLLEWKELPPFRSLRSRPADANLARNAGIDGAKGKWLALLDADDEFTPNKLSSMRRTIEAGDAEIFLSRGTRVRGEGKRSIFPHSLPRQNENMAEYFFSRGCNCSTTSIVVRADIARLVRFAPGLPKFQDNDFLIRGQAQGARIRMLDDPLFVWHDTSETGRISRGGNYEQQIAWARSLSPAFNDKAFHAFCARRVAQYIFPRDPIRNLQRFWNGWRHGGVTSAETAFMLLRAMLPAWLALRGVSLYSRLSQPRDLRAERDNG